MYRKLVALSPFTMKANSTTGFRWFSQELLETCIDVMEAAWPWRIVMGAQVLRHHTRITLSQLAEAISVFS